MDPDADDDYMGDLSHFLPPDPSSSPSRSLGRRKQPTGQGQQQPAAAPRAKRAKGVPWQERRRQERERKQREEDARTIAGLAEAIPESNVGFKMLKQMGYDPGARGAAAEPVGIEIRRSRAGLGAEPAAAPAPVPVERSREEVERERRRQEEMVVELGARKSTKWRAGGWCGTTARPRPRSRSWRTGRSSRLLRKVTRRREQRKRKRKLLLKG